MSAPADVPARAPRWLGIVRGLGLLVLLVFFCSGMVARQILELDWKKTRYLPAWNMYSGIGVGHSQVEFWTVAADGQTEVVDAYEVLELERSYFTKVVFKVKGREAAHRLGKRLCAKLGPGTDLRMKVRTARKDRWRIDARGEDNLCRTSPTAYKNKKNKKRKRRGASS